jgi:IS30 family transposase
VYEQLSLSERIYIQSRLEFGFKAAAIASALKRGPSTIGRERRRNGRIAADIPSAIDETVRQHANIAATAV